jgi:hypothetical protein
MGLERILSDRRTIAFTALGLASIAAAATLAYWGRGQTIGPDELRYATRLSTESFGHALIYPPPGAYLIAAPLFVYQGLFETAGLGAYAAHRAVAIALVITCAILFFALARRSVGDLWALPPSLLMLFFGYGSEQVLTAERIPGSMALAAGLAMLLALTGTTLRRDFVAAFFLTLSLASHPSGVAFVAAAAVLVLSRPSPERWTRAWVFLFPALLYGAWWLLLRPGGHPPTQTDLGELASFVGDSWTAVTAALTGVAGVVDGHAHEHALGWLVGACLLALVVVGATVSRRRLTAQFWAAAAAVLVLWLSTGFIRGNTLLVTADQPRYVYPAAFLMLLMLVELAGAVRLRSWGAWIATGVVALGLVANVYELNDAGTKLRSLTDPVRAAYGATEIASKTVQPNYLPLGFFYPAADRYLAAARAFGSVGYSPAELAGRPAATRLAADKTLVEAEQVDTDVRSPRAAGGEQAPQVEHALQATTRKTGGCLTLRPSPDHEAGPLDPSIPPPQSLTGAPALAAITLPRGGVSIAAQRLGEMGISVGRFAELPAVPLEMPEAGHYASLAIRDDGVAVPWRLIVYSSERVSLCGLGPSGD